MLCRAKSVEKYCIVTALILELCRGEYEWLNPITLLKSAKKKKKEEKRLQKAGVDNSEPQDVQPIPGNDDKAITTGDT